MASASIPKDISKAKRNLIKKAISKGGVYENFGQNEYIKLKDKWNKYIGKFGSTTDYEINKQLQEFYHWILNMDDRKLNVLIANQ